jgi:hypothetical protein
LRQPLGATALFPFFDFGSRKHFEGHFESGVLLFVLVAVTGYLALPPSALWQF